MLIQKAEADPSSPTQLVVMLEPSQGPAELQVLVKKFKKWGPIWVGLDLLEARKQYRAAPRPRRLMVTGVSEPLEEEA